MGRWRNFLDSLDTGGGHIFVVFCILALAMMLFVYDATAGGGLITGALSALYVMLRQKGTNREQLNGDADHPPSTGAGDKQS